MPSLAFARPMWPATLCALRELTRLALASLVLAVGLGATVAADPPERSVAGPPPTMTVAVDPPLTAAVTVEPAHTAEVAPTWREPVTTASTPLFPARRVHASAATGTGPADHPVPASTAREGEPTRRGPPDA